MKAVSMLIFFTIFISLYGSLSYYVFLRGSQSIPWDQTSRTLYKYLFLAITLAFPLGRIFERISLNWFTSSMVWVGSYWFAFFFYLILSIVLIDIIRLIDSGVHFLPQAVLENYPIIKRTLALTCLSIISLFVIKGTYNANNTIVSKVEITLDTYVESMEKLSIVFVSDIHMGTIIKNSKLEHMVELINAQNPDIVLLGGDIVDEDLGPVVKNNLGETIRNITSKYGTYGITGNHEYIGGVSAAEAYLTEHGITMLRDSAILIDNAFYLIGRNDSSSYRMTGIPRKELHTITDTLQSTIPTILLDHQPNGIRDAVSQNIDIILSGHTHAGQIWPISYITNILFENSWGHKQFEKTHSYVSSGFGTWGPPIRLGNNPEIVEIVVKFR